MVALRIALGVIIGVVLGVGIVMAGDWINHRLWPPPPEVQVTNPEAIRDYMANAPITSLLGLPATWAIAALAAAFAGAKIGARAWAGWIAGGLMFAATLANLAMIPHPLWMLISALVFVPLAAWLGAKLAA
jgi:hypothetical protein